MKTLFNKNIQDQVPEILPVVPTMDVVVFPHTIVPLLVVDEKVINGIDDALKKSKIVLLVASRKQVTQQEAIGTKDLYQIGTIASIMRLIKIPEGGIKILVQGLSKARIKDIIVEGQRLYANIAPLEQTTQDNQEMLNAQIKNIKSLTEKIAFAGNSFSPDFHLIIAKMSDPEKIADFILSHLTLSVEQAQELLETKCQNDLFELLYHHLNREMEVAEIQERIRNNARDSINKSQKEFYLREQIKAIKKELGEDDIQEIEAMRENIQKISMSDENKKEVLRQINRLEKTTPDSMESAVIRNYLDWVFSLPWGVETTDNIDINHAAHVLDEDHFGLKDIKDRILDYMSIRILKQDGHTPILCFVGPPGTGKTSLGKSIARSLGRAYVRISLGGVKDEAEIRGHRRTYVGAMPGRFIQAIRKSASCNPVVVIDELDKIGADFRGDPSAAMLEVLDPQQNKTFHDNYLGIPFDLSKVLFIATANNIGAISEPLRDRMEIIELSSYTVEEKINIANRHLIRRAIEETGLNGHDLAINLDVLSDIVTNYTKESGVRQLDRIIKQLCSKAARALVEKNNLLTFTNANLDTFLGPRKFLQEYTVASDQVGISNGLAWTAYGGELIKVEAVLLPGKGKLILTGQLGSVMKESAQAALSYARAHAKDFAVDPKAFSNHDLHVHFPAGAIPKDGPSAGITILTAIFSALTKRPINGQYAMTGEINLQGEVMPIGGVKEKILAAKRNQLNNVILPARNKNDLVGLEDIAKDINVIWVQSADEVLNKVLLPHRKA